MYMCSGRSEGKDAKTVIEFLDPFCGNGKTRGLGSSYKKKKAFFC